MTSTSHLSRLFQQHRSAVAFVSAPIALFLILTPLRAAQQNYGRWLNLAPGGLPHNVWGWLINWMMWPLGLSDMTSVWPFLQPRFVKPYGQIAKKTYLKEPLPWREPYGARPYVDGNCTAPQRQESQVGVMTEGVREKEALLLKTLASSHPQTTRIATSQQEARGPALFLAENLSPPAWAARTRGEIAHIHIDAEGSGHCSLTPADAMEVVEKGWGQRHRLSHWIHIGFVMIYAPRNEHEVEVMKRIFGAAIDAFVDGAKEKGS